MRECSSSGSSARWTSSTTIGRSNSGERVSARCSRSCCCTAARPCPSIASSTSCGASGRPPPRSRPCRSTCPTCAGRSSRTSSSSSRGGYALAVDAERIDALRFERLVDEGRAALADDDPARAAELLRSALALWRGPALGDLAYERFAQDEVARLEELRLAAVEERIEADLRLGRHVELVAELEGLVREHPLRERLRAQHMLALYRSGRQADALESFRDARRSLVDELGLEPGRELRELEQAILAQDPALDPPRGRAPRPPPARRRRGLALIAAGAALAVRPSPSPWR